MLQGGRRDVPGGPDNIVTPGHVRSAEALSVLRTHGELSFAYIAERVCVHSGSGDVAGAQRWIEIAGKLDALHDAEQKPQ